MARLSGLAVGVDLPTGWDGRIYRRQATEAQAGEVQAAEANEVASTTYAVLHAASFPLPTDRGDYGSGAVDVMQREDVLVTLVEHGPEGADSALFATAGPPRELSVRDFSPDALQRSLPGQAGAQVFFTADGRAFCLYVVLGSYDHRDRLVPLVNALLRSLRLGGGG